MRVTHKRSIKINSLEFDTPIKNAHKNKKRRFYENNFRRDRFLPCDPFSVSFL